MLPITHYSLSARKGPNVFVLSQIFESRTYHFEILRQGVYYFMEEGPYMKSMAHLVRHYCAFADGLPSRLTKQVRIFCQDEERFKLPSLTFEAN